jgi:protein disulfide-isomerase
MKKIYLLFFIISSDFGLFSQDFSIIFRNTVNSTVTIETDNGYIGSGFFVAPYIIATNYHVIQGAKSANCYLNNSDKKYLIEGYVGVDKAVDLVLLKVSKLNKPALKFAINTATVGQKVAVIGSPKGLSATISEGIVSGMRDFDGYKLIQMTAPISPGSSGGPVLNLNGELLGISVLQFKDGQNLNFAIPKSSLQTLLEFKKDTPSELSKLNDLEETEINQEVEIPRDINEFVWYTDMNKAIAISQITKKPLLLFFTGSDWCGWCIRLQKEVFLTETFTKWAKENVILVELDFPKSKTQTDAIKQQNNQLQQTFAVQGYPTVFFVTAGEDGKINLPYLGKSGYMAGGPDKWIEVANTMIQKK